jgi:hypothetical protein
MGLKVPSRIEKRIFTGRSSVPSSLPVVMVVGRKIAGSMDATFGFSLKNKKEMLTRCSQMAVGTSSQGGAGKPTVHSMSAMQG